MADSRNDLCAGFQGRILDLANGEAVLAQDPALAVHLKDCEACRRRLAFDQGDRRRRQARYSGLGFPQARSREFWGELDRRVALERARRNSRERWARVAASLFLVAGGIWLGLLFGPRLRKQEPAFAPASAPRTAEPRRTDAGRRTDLFIDDVQAQEADGRSRFAWPELRLVSDAQGGF